MIIYSFNDQLSDTLVEELSKTIKVDMYQHPPVDGGFPFYSSYNVGKVRHFPDAIERYYDDKFRRILYHLDLKKKKLDFNCRRCLEVQHRH